MAVSDPEFARLLVDAIRSGLVAVDAEARVQALNAGAQRILGLTAEASGELFGRPCQDVLAGQPVLCRLLLEAVAGHEPPPRAELVLEPVAGGPARTIGFTLVPLAGARGAAIFFRDLTPYERMDEQDRLRERLAALGQMAAGLAHEIRNPLASMEVIAGLLRRRLSDRPEALELLAEITGELRQIGGTVTDCLEFVRPASPAPRDLDPAALLEEALERALSRVDAPVALTRDVEAPLPRLHADADQLRAVLTDLAINALEALAADPPESPELRVGVRSEARNGDAAVLKLGGPGDASEPAWHGNEVVFTIADNGPGIPAEVRERIFYPFFTTKKRGSGIGLATAQKVVASHGGVIDLESRPGEGATFRVRLPVVAAPGAIPPPSGVEAA